MKIALWYAPYDVRVENVPIPEVGPEDVLIKTKVSLTCGTDVKTYKRGHPSAKPPWPLGHEVAGDIVSVGERVKYFKEGMRVVPHNTAPCGECYFCKTGRPDGLCENKVRIYGGHSEYVLVPGRIVRQNLFEIPGDIPYKAAALTEPLSCAVYGVESTPVTMGDTVAVNGAGPLGLMIAMLLKIKGCVVIQSDYSPSRLETARQIGVDYVIDLNKVDDQVEAVKQLTPGGRGPDAVIEAVGLPEVWEKSVKMVRQAGHVNLFGGCKTGTSFNLDTHRIHYDGVKVFGVFHTTPKHVKLAFDLICQKKIDWNILITRELPYSALMDAIQLHANQDGVKNALIYE
jgi:L-iditol 2-dehydrogenase